MMIISYTSQKNCKYMNYYINFSIVFLDMKLIILLVEMKI